MKKHVITVILVAIGMAIGMAGYNAWADHKEVHKRIENFKSDCLMMQGSAAEVYTTRGRYQEGWNKHWACIRASGQSVRYDPETTERADIPWKIQPRMIPPHIFNKEEEKK
jgi:hypothetical protein